jgi:amidase
MLHHVRADQTSFSFRADIEPKLTVQLGDTVTFETSPNPPERLLNAGENWLDALDIRAINAVTGPVYIEGVQAGDAIAVEILDVVPGDWGWNASIPGFGLLGGVMPAPMLQRVPLSDGRIHLSDRLTLPIKPMIGCLGFAPATGETSTLKPPQPWAGNWDLIQVKPGNTIIFPVQVDGGLFSLGDLHAAMGAGEATFVSIECPGSATVRFTKRPALKLVTPRIETPDQIIIIGLDGSDGDQIDGDLDVARKQASELMYGYLTDEVGLTSDEAYGLVSASVDLEFGGPAAAVVLASVPRSVVAPFL